MTKKARKLCLRCGIERKHESVRRLCRDCRYVMSEEETALWYDEEPSVEFEEERDAA